MLNCKNNPWRAGILMIFSCLLLSPFVNAEDEIVNPFDDEADFLTALMEARHYDWAKGELELLKKEYPGQKDELAYLEAIVALRTKRAEGIEKLKAIPESNKRYGDALYLLAQYENDTEKRQELLNKWLNKVTRVKDSNRAEFFRVMKSLIDSSVEKGDIDAALATYQRCIPLIRKDKVVKSELQYQEAFYCLNAVDYQVSQGKKADAKLLARAKKQLDTLLWNQNYFGILSYLEMARYNLFINKPKEALSNLNSAYPFIKKWEQQMTKDQLDLPKANMFYYLGRVYAKMGELEKTDEKADKWYQRSSKSLVKAIKDHGGNSFANDAQKFLANQNEMTEERFGWVLKAGRGIKQAERDLNSGHMFFNDGKYEEAAETYISLAMDMDVKSQRAAEIFDDCLKYATISYYKKAQEDVEKYGHNFLKATVLADVFSERRSDSMKAMDALYFTAGANYTAAVKNYAEKPEIKKLYMTDAIELYKKLLKLKPDYSSADRAAWRVANYNYAKAFEANQALIAANKELEGTKDEAKVKEQEKKVAKLREDMYQAYRDIIPHYEVIIRDHKTKKYGILSFYRLARIYLVLNDAAKAAENFQEYLELEKNPVYEKAEAKYLAANQFYKADKMDEALKHYEELVEWLAPDGPFMTSKGNTKDQKERMVRFRKSVKAQIPFVFDKQARVYLDKAKELKKGIGDLKDAIEQLKSSWALEQEQKKAASEKPEAAPEKEEAPEGAKEEDEAAAPAEKTDAPAEGTDAPAEKAGDDEEMDEEEAADAIAEADAKKREELGIVAGKLPLDYELKFLTEIKDAINLVKDLPENVELIVPEENRLWFIQGKDWAMALAGKGLPFKGGGKDFILEKQNAALYRGGFLIGIYDATTGKVRQASEGEAPAKVQRPEPQFMAKSDYDLRMARYEFQLAPMEKVIAELEEKGLKIQNKALELLQEFYDANSKDDKLAPRAISKIGYIYLRRKNFDKAAEWLQKLTKDFPNSSYSQNTLFQMLRAYIESGEPEKAAEISVKIKEKLPEYPIANLSYLATSFFSRDKQREWQCLNPEISIAANEEIVRRAKEGSGQEQATAKKLRERSLYYAAIGYYIRAKDLRAGDEKIPQFVQAALDNLAAVLKNDKTPYLWEALFMTAKANRLVGRTKDSLNASNEVLAYVDKAKYTDIYYRGLIASGRTLIASNDKNEIKAGIGRFKLIYDYYDKSQDEKLSIYLQMAYVGLIHGYSFLDDRENASKFITEYRRKFPHPKGVFGKEARLQPSK